MAFVKHAPDVDSDSLVVALSNRRFDVYLPLVTNAMVSLWFVTHGQQKVVTWLLLDSEFVNEVVVGSFLSSS